MADKRYYYLKLKQDFFNSKEIKKLRKIAGGDTFTIIYLRMLLMSASQDGMIYFDGLCEDIAEEISLELDEDIDNVKMTLSYLTSINALEKGQLDEVYLNEISAMIGSECDSAERVRKHRRNLALGVKNNEIPLQCNTDVTKCNPILEIDIEKEKEINIDIDYEQNFEELWKLYPKKLGKNRISTTTKKKLLKNKDDVLKAINNYKAEIAKNRTEEQFIKHGSTFFNKDWEDYLTSNQQEKRVIKSEGEIIL